MPCALLAAAYFSFASSAMARAQEPAAASPRGQPLRESLHDLVRGHTRLTYAELWSVLPEAHADLSAPGFLRTVYKNARVAPGATSTDWNREHLWPTSYGFPQDNRCNYPYTDAHHVFPANPGYNSTRGNGPFDFCLIPGAICDPRPVDDHPDTPNLRRRTSGEWEVWSGKRGDVARALFYMDVRYAGGTHPTTDCAEPDLVLTDDLALVVTTTESPAYMSRLCALVEWHLEDPVGPEDLARNEVVASRQGNRNPFIDSPELVLELFSQCEVGGGEPGPGDVKLFLTSLLNRPHAPVGTDSL